MKAQTDFVELDTYLGTSSPVWKLTGDSNALSLSPAGADTGPVVGVELTQAQANTIRNFSGESSMTMLEVRILGKRAKLHLVGKMIGQYEWAGMAALLSNSKSVASNSMQALAFAEGIVTEVNAIVVVLDKAGTIHRFNRKAEEYTNCTQKQVIGENAQDLFMSIDEGENSRNNISRFFDQRQPQDVERIIKTNNGARPFLFRNRFLQPMHGDAPEFIVCSGVEIVVPESAGKEVVTGEEFELDVMRNIADWRALVNGVRALLDSADGSLDPDKVEDAKRLATFAVRDADHLYNKIDARLMRAMQEG
ncbi:PAS domain-containing protein [Burkholderia sp. Ac-20345]|uniref:PAS domain S-box protein n=1 Tax=Burkholderia sp. Ac-20345 TaxID=2703891 RepID=UPI00197BBF84|nr:PAS domain S-box protein [Burkholderia sp. Ac-20345]MBN3780505.1 PAS domain-containing protein [Burkholderia sp. Ac-20345]